MKIDWRWEAPQLALLGVMLLVTGLAWSAAPDSVPVHWNLQGEVDGYASKPVGLLMTPGIAAGLYLLLLFLPRIDPGRDNIANSKALRAIRLAFMVFLTGLHIVTVRAALGSQLSMNVFVSLSVAVLFIVLGNYMGKLRPNWMAGIRTPWTLSSPRSWTKTHQLGGPVLMGIGVSIGLLGVFPSGWLLAIVIGGSAIALIGLVVYSYVVWRDDPDRIPPSGVSPGPNGD